jgi:hypothetical protein
MERAARDLLPEVPRAEAVSEIQTIENDALDFMKSILPKNQADAENTVNAWLSAVKSRQDSGQKLSVMEHSALTFALRSGLIEKIANPEDVSAMRTMLKKSWKDLSGKDVDIVHVTDRLPKRVLKSATVNEVIFHNAIYSDGKLGFLGSLSTLRNNYIAKPQDYVLGLSFLATLFSHTEGSQVLAGMMEGYAISSFIEYAVHRYASHSTQSFREFLSSVPVLRRFVEKATLAHAGTHHAVYGKNYVEAYGDFRPGADGYEEAVTRHRDKIDRITEARKAKVEGFGKLLESTDGGSSFGRPIMNALEAAPLSVSMVWFTNVLAPHFGMHPDLAFDAATVVTANLFIPSVNYLHPYLHMTRQQAMAKADPFMKWFLNTRFILWVSRAHYIHHKDGV